MSGLVRHLSDRLMVNGGTDPYRVVTTEAAKVLVAATEDGDLLGSITLFEFESFSGHHGWLEDLVVSPGARGQGIGAALMTEAVRTACRDGVEKLLSCSHPRRLAANRIHLSAGFEKSESNLYRLRFNAAPVT